MLQQNEKDIIFDRFGTPAFRILTDNRIVGFDGSHIGVLGSNGAVYNYTPKQVGWYEKGVFRDMDGTVAGFGVSPTDFPAPIFPIRHLLPIRRIIRIPPVIPVLPIASIKPIKKFGWTLRSIEWMFKG